MEIRQASRKISELLLYSLPVTILLSPYFTPFSVVGPEGFLRGDQIILPILIIVLGIAHSDQFRVPTDMVVIGLFGAIIVIALSIILNGTGHGGVTSIGDLFDLLIWISYFGLVITIGGNVSIPQARRTILLIVGLSVGVAALGILQWLNLEIATETVAQLYTTRLDTVGREPTSTLQNPNSLGKLLVLPLFFCFAQTYRMTAGGWPMEQNQSSVVWLILTIVFAVGVVVTGARSALVGLVFGFGIVCLIIISSKLGNRKIRQLFVWTAVGSVLVGFVLLIGVFEVGRLANLQNPLQDDSLQARFGKWRVVLPLILEQPLFGYGPSKAAQLEIGVPHIDSGFLSWWYHYGILGVITFLALLIGIMKTGISIVVDSEIFRSKPIFWSTAIAIVGWSYGVLVSWTFVGVPQDRRVFLLFLVLLSLLLTVIWNK